MPIKLRLVAAACAAFTAVSVCFGTQPFEIDVSNGLSVQGTSIVDLVQNLIKAQDQFASLSSSPTFGATATFLGVPNALSFNYTSAGPGGVQVQFNIPSINYTKTFTGPDRNNVETQLKDFIEKDGSSILAQFLKSIAKESPNAVTDGNPNAATATMASNTFFSQGFTSTSELAPGTNEERPNLSGFGLGFNGGQFNAGGMKGNNLDIAVPFKIKFTDRLSLAGNIPINYLTLEGAKVYGIGLNLGLPYRVLIMDRSSPWNWRVTPSVGTDVRGSEDLASGAALWDAGLTSSVDYRVNSKLIVCMINQLTHYSSFRVTYGSYSFDPDIRQEILKDGVRCVTPLTPRLIGDVFVIDTRFLKDAAVKSFETYGGSLSFHLTRTMNLSLGANYDNGDRFRAWSVGCSSAWKL
jgi:hypothetical protein